MKKVLSILLVTVMLLTLSMGAFAVPASAETDTRVHPYAIDTTDTEIDINGTKFTVIRTVEEFISMKPTSSSGWDSWYILANDLDFSDYISDNGAFTKTVVSGGSDGKLHHFIFEGNGYSLKNLVLNFSTEQSAIFPSASNRKHEVRNLTVSASGTIAAKNCGTLFSYPIGNTPGVTNIQVEHKITNVTVNGNFTVNSNCNNFGGFIGYISSTTEWNATLTDCIFNGSINSSANDVGAFVSWIKGTKTTFTRCNVNLTSFSAKQLNGGFVGCVDSAAVVFEDCAVNNDAFSVSTNAAGGYIGRATNTADIKFTGCTAKGEYTQNNSYGLSSFVSQIYHASVKLVFEKCINEATLNANASNGVAGFVGVFTNKTATVSFTDCMNVGSATSDNVSEKPTAGFCGQPNNANAKITFTRCLSVGTTDKAFIADNNVTANLTINDSVSLKDVPLTNNDTAIAGKTTTQITKDELAAGKAAYLLAEAGADVGQRIGKDAYPVFGSVYSVAMRGDKYVNAFKGNADGSATAYLQLADSGEGVRALFVVKADSIEDITDMQIAIKFNLTNGGTRSRTEDVSNYFTSVLADGTEIYGDEGWVIVGIEVTGVPENAWKSFEFKLTSGDGTNAAYNATASYSTTNS